MTDSGRHWVLASGNPGKVSEMAALLAPLDITLHRQSEYDTPEAEETGLTFVENAIIKARNACEYSGLPAIADDSGLEVDALNGRPGIYSARFSGEGATDERNNAHLLSRLEGIPDHQRTARYRCCMVFLRHASDPSPVIAQGTLEGLILPSGRGSGGFGYDPLFFVQSHNCTAAEMEKSEKNRISHRGKAMRKLIEQLQQLDY